MDPKPLVCSHKWPQYRSEFSSDFPPWISGQLILGSGNPTDLGQETKSLHHQMGTRMSQLCNGMRIVDHVYKEPCTGRWALVSTVRMMLRQQPLFRWIYFKLFTWIWKNQIHICHSLSIGKGNWLCTFRYQPYTVRASRSARLWTCGRREHLLFLRKNLEAGLPPPRTGRCTESLCKGNAEPWPWASLGDPQNGNCFKHPQRDGKWNLETVISGQWCIIKMLVATLQYC